MLAFFVYNGFGIKSSLLTITNDSLFWFLLKFFNEGSLRAQFILDFIRRNIEQNLFYLEFLLNNHPIPDFQYLTG